MVSFETGETLGQGGVNKPNITRYLASQRSRRSLPR